MRTGVRASCVFLGVLLASPLAAQETLQSGERLLAKRDFAGAETFFRQAIQREPESWRAHADLFLALLMQHKSEEAAAEGKCAVDLAPNNPALRLGYGQALEADHKPLEAAREFEKAIVLMPGKPGPLRALAGAYASAEDPRATAIFEEFLALFREDAGGRVQFAEYLWAIGLESRGNQIMTEAVNIAPFNAELRFRYGTALFHQQRFLDAVEELQQARRIASKSYSILYLLGNALSQVGKTDLAIETLEEAVRLKPENPAAQHDLGKLLWASGHAEKAIAPLEKAASLDPNEPAGWLDLGRAYEAVGRLPDAEQSYRKAVGLAANLSAPHYALGRLLLRQGKRRDAERELGLYQDLYNRAAKAIFETDSRGAELALAWQEFKGGKTSAALERFQSLPETPESLIGRAMAFSRLERHQEAVAALERALSLAPESKKAQSFLAEERERVEERR